MEFSSKVTLIASVVIIAACCGGTALLISPLTDVVTKRETEAKEFGDKVVVDVLGTWESKALIPYANEIMSTGLDDAGFSKRLSGNHAALGNYRSGDSKANIVGTRKFDGKSVMLARYENKATFEKAKAAVRLDLEYKDKKWKVATFSIDPE